MKPLGKDEDARSGKSGAIILNVALRNMIRASSFLSVVTLALVILSYYVIPARIENERVGRLEELQAMRELADSVNDLTERVMELQSAGTNASRNP